MTSLSPSSLLEALNWRYATKAFDPSKSIPDAAWESLKSALHLAPSSFGLQPWKFIEVSSGELRSKIQSAAWHQPQIVDAPKLLVLAARKSVGEAEISHLISAIAKERDLPAESLEGYKGMMLGFLKTPPFPLNPEEWATRQVYLALGVLLSAAAVLGVDSCPMEGFIPSQVDSILGLESSEFSAKVLCPLGYRSSSDGYAGLKKVRYPIGEIYEVR